MAEFAYNNAKNTSTGHTLFKLNSGYQSCIFYKKNLNPCLKSKSAKEQSSKLQKLMTVCQQNFYHAQELHKQIHDKGVKLQSFMVTYNSCQFLLITE